MIDFDENTFSYKSSVSIDPIEDWYNKIHAIVDILPYSDENTILPLCKLLKDMLPNLDQAKKIFETKDQMN